MECLYFAAMLFGSWPIIGAQDQILSVRSAGSDQIVLLRGAGSTFAAPLYKKWIEEYGVSHRGVTISYDAVGSGEGVKRYLEHSVDFAGSDEVLSSNELATVPDALMLPITAGMIAIAYNIPGVNSEIKLPRNVYVDIFARKIRKWDDPRIQAANPRIAFPRRDIALVVRQDSSGTTAAFTNHLATIGSSWRAAAWTSESLLSGRAQCCRHPATKVWLRASGLAKARSATSNIGSLSGLACGWQRCRTKRGTL